MKLTKVRRATRAARWKPHAQPLRMCWGISARTLVHWERRDKVRPNADSIMAPRDALLYGDAVHFPDAVADVVELLALDDPEKTPELSAYVAALRARGFPRGPERTWLDDMVSTDEADEHE